MSELPEITEVQRLRLEPGDALVIRLEREPSMAEADAIKERIRVVLGRDDLPVLVFGPGASIEVTASYTDKDFITYLQKQIRIHGGLARMGLL
jgi:hypothetical protein